MWPVLEKFFVFVNKAGISLITGAMDKKAAPDMIAGINVVERRVSIGREQEVRGDAKRRRGDRTIGTRWPCG